MNRKFEIVKWATPSLILLASLGGCAKKPKPPAPEPAARMEVPAAPSSNAPGVSEEELRRRRIMDEAREVFQTIYYPLDQSTLDVRAKSVLAGINKFMKEQGEVSFTVAGHCDERGTEEYNLALGEQRARAVTKYLSDLGVSESRMRIISYGEERPASVGRSESSWSLNRRAEFTPEFRFELSGVRP